MPARKYTDEQIEKALDLREKKGLSYKVIERLTGMDSRSVGWHCMRNAVTPPAKPGAPRTKPLRRSYERNGASVRQFSPAEDKTILAMSKEGHSGAAIGRHLDRKPHTIRNRILTLAYHQELFDQDNGVA